MRVFGIEVDTSCIILTNRNLMPAKHPGETPDHQWDPAVWASLTSWRAVLERGFTVQLKSTGWLNHQLESASHRAAADLPDNSIIDFDFRCHFIIIYARFNVERSKDSCNPQEKGAIRKVFSGTDPAGGAENPILGISHRRIELPIFQEAFGIEYMWLRIYRWIIEEGPDVLHDCCTFGYAIPLVGVIFRRRLGDAYR